MTTKEAMNYEEAVLTSAKEWVKGEASIEHENELCILAEYYKIKLPACMHHFLYSHSPDHFCATGAYKTIMKTLDKLAAAIRKAENI